MPIESDPDICGGLPRIVGTRLTVGDILDRLVVHGNIADVVAYYRESKVTVEDVRECLSFASEVLDASWMSILEKRTEPTK